MKLPTFNCHGIEEPEYEEKLIILASGTLFRSPV